jgi:hypothetical protein
MTLSLQQVTEISRAIVEKERDLDLIGVASTDGGSGRVEVLMTIAGCHEEPCVLMLNLARGERAALERELRIKLRGALAAHAAS